MKPPCLIFEDDHLLVINKPAGLNTHSPSPFSGEGLYEWLRHREPRWARLAIIHRLDKETSGLILFSKSSLANRSLTEQFTNRAVKKKYLLLTDRAVPTKKLVVKSTLVRSGDKYFSRPVVADSEIAHTTFSLIGGCDASPGQLVEAEPFTGRTHQLRVHAADQGFPILGDVRYGGTSYPRVCLHSAELRFRHPASGESLLFAAPPDFSADPTLSLRRALINPQSTTAFRVIHGASDGWPGWYVDLLGSHLLSQSSAMITESQRVKLAQLIEAFSSRGAYHKQLSASARAAGREQASPRLVLGSPAADRFSVLENGLQFWLSFAEGYSVGLFHDQRENRRRLLTGYVAPDFELIESKLDLQSPERRSPAGSAHGFKDREPVENAPAASAPIEVLNTFAYTCGFSVYAAKAGGAITSLDLSKKYLGWGQENFRLNEMSPEDHDFIFGDVFDWLRRLQKKDRSFDVILLDPPTFSRSKSIGLFRAEQDYGRLVAAALPLLKTRGVLFASCNTAKWPAEDFLVAARASIRESNRTILQETYFPQPPDFPVSRAEPAHLKTVWFRVG